MKRFYCLERVLVMDGKEVDVSSVIVDIDRIESFSPAKGNEQLTVLKMHSGDIMTVRSTMHQVYAVIMTPNA